MSPSGGDGRVPTRPDREIRRCREGKRRSRNVMQPWYRPCLLNHRKHRSQRSPSVSNRFLAVSSDRIPFPLPPPLHPSGAIRSRGVGAGNSCSICGRDVMWSPGGGGVTITIQPHQTPNPRRPATTVLISKKKYFQKRLFRRAKNRTLLSDTKLWSIEWMNRFLGKTNFWNLRWRNYGGRVVGGYGE